jgi:DNA N-6-adenine-methyltransferase (Dam)
MPYVDHYVSERKQDRRTPKTFFDKLNYEFSFTLDGAATGDNALISNYSSPDKPREWEGEKVFCNPPWAEIPPFIELAATADLAVLLVPARVNAKWFHRALALGGIPRYWQGKLSFDGPWNSPVDCLLLIFRKGK